MRKSRWLWVLLFISFALILGTLATGWNVVLVRDYREMLALAHRVAQPQETNTPHAPWLSLWLGTFGFLAALGTMVLFFVRLLQEMRLNQQQSEFLAAVTHELKTPIAAIDLSASMLEQGGLSKSDAARLWSSHRLELRRLRDDVEKLLEAARWQSNPPKARRVPLELEGWVTRSLPRWKDLLGPGASLSRAGDSLPFAPALDEASVTLIADNILSNARKFARGAPRVTVTTKLVPARGFGSPLWEVSFHDEGWGFDPMHAKKIFHRFFRGRNLAPYAIPGTGLGLSLALAAGKATGVRLAASSDGREKGATFTIQGALRRHAT